MLINGLSGAVKLISQEKARKFFAGEVTDELRPFFTNLTPEEESNQARLLCKFLLEKARRCADGTIVVTYDCNLKCPYCYETRVKHPDIMEPVIDRHKVDKAFDALEYLNEECTGDKPLTLTGGEPLMKKNRKIVEYIFKKGADLGYTFTVFSNGVELNHFISLLSSAPLDHVKITLDGPPFLHDKRRILRKGKGSFDTIVENIEKARFHKIPLVIRTNSDAAILDHIDQLVNIFKERGWVSDPSIQFSLVNVCEPCTDRKTIEKEAELYKRVMEMAKRPGLQFLGVYPLRKLSFLSKRPLKFWPSFWSCNTVTKRYVFDPLGDVYPCRGMVGWKEERIGQYVPKLRFNEKFNQWHKRTIFAMEKCTTCEVALVCGGDCGYASLLKEGDLFVPVCTTPKSSIRDYVQYLVEQGNL